MRLAASVSRKRSEQFGGAAIWNRGGGHAIEAADHLQVLAPGQQFVEGGVLPGDPDPAADLMRMLDDIEPGDRGAAGIGFAKGGQNAHCRRFAGAIGAEQGENLAFGHIEGDTAQGVGLAERFGEVFGEDNRGR